MIIAENDINSSLPIGTKKGHPIYLRFYNPNEIPYNDSKFIHGEKFLLAKPFSWDNPILKDLWEVYKEYRKAKGSNFNDNLDIFH